MISFFAVPNFDQFSMESFTSFIYLVSYIFDLLQSVEQPIMSSVRRTTIRLDAAVTRNGIFDMNSFRNFITHRPEHKKALQNALSHKISTFGSDEKSGFNHLLYANIVYNQFWDYSFQGRGGRSIDGTDPIEFLTPDKIFILEHYAPRFQPFTTPFISTHPAPSTSIKYLILAGDLDSRTPPHQSQQLYDSLLVSSKQLVRFANRGHLISGSDPCFLLIIEHFYSSSSEPIPDCIKAENQRSLDWLQRSMIVSGLFPWSLGGTPWWFRARVKMVTLSLVCPFWWLVPVSFLVILGGIGWFIKWIIAFSRNNGKTQEVPC